MRIHDAAIAVMMTTVLAAPAAGQRAEDPAAVETGIFDAVRIGVVGGGGIAWVSAPERSLDMRYRPGWSAGVVGTAPITRNFAFQGEVLYSRKGVAVDLFLTNAEQIVTAVYDSRYIEVPLLARYAIRPDWDLVRPYLIAGPAPAYLISRTFRRGDGGIPAEDKTDESERFDVGIVVGGGASVPTSYGVFELDVRANFGLRDIQANSDSSTGSLALQGSNNTRTFLLMAGYSLPLSMLPGFN